MFKPIALLYDLVELVPVAVATIAISPDTLLALAQILRAQVLCQELAVAPALVEAVSVGFSLAVALLVEHGQQHVISVLDQITSHAIARLRQ